MRSQSLPSLLRRAGVASVLGLGLAAASCGSTDTTATAYLTWQIVDASDPSPQTAPALTCQQKGVTTVRVQLTPLASGSVFDFPCANMAGETFTVPSGTYTVQTIALNANFSAVAQLTFTQRLFGRTNLGHIIFQVR